MSQVEFVSRRHGIIYRTGSPYNRTFNLQRDAVMSRDLFIKHMVLQERK